MGDSISNKKKNKDTYIALKDILIDYEAELSGNKHLFNNEKTLSSIRNNFHHWKTRRQIQYSMIKSSCDLCMEGIISFAKVTISILVFVIVFKVLWIILCNIDTCIQNPSSFEKIIYAVAFGIGTVFTGVCYSVIAHLKKHPSCLENK